MSSRIPTSSPLTPLQYGMLMHYLLHADDGADIQQMEVRLPRDMDLDAFEGAWRLVFERHDALRIQFAWEGLDAPLQTCGNKLELPFEVCDLSNHADSRRELDAFLKHDRKHGFKLDHAPLMRLHVFRKTSWEPILIWTTHHTILDGRSRVIVLREVFDAYDAIVGGRRPDLGRTSSYHDYAHWCSSQNLEPAEKYWKGVLNGFSQRTRLPGELTRSVNGIKGSGRSKLQIGLSRAETEHLCTFSAAAKVTINSVVQGAWSLLLSRYSGSNDVVFGAVRACRNGGPKGTKSTVGMLINTVPVRINTESNQLVARWLKDVRQQWVGMRSFERTPLSQIQRWADISSGSSLFDSLLVFENYDLEEAVGEGATSDRGSGYRVVTQTSFPIALSVNQSDLLRLNLEFNRSLLTETEAGRLLVHFKNILLDLGTTGDATLADVTMLSDAERNELLWAWNDTRVTYPREKSLWELFSDIAMANPDAVAVSCESSTCTYRSLRRRALAIAAELQHCGIKNGDIVGILGEQRISTIAGILGIVAAGAAYLPLDPVYPRRRLEYMIRQSRAGLLIGQPSLVQKIGLEMRGLDPERDSFVFVDEFETAALESTNVVDGGSAAYVMFTSGSTGDPKGSVIMHRAVSRFILDSEYVDLLPSSVFAQISSLSFDLSVFEIWGALLHGCELALIDRMLVLSPFELKIEIERTGTTHIDLTTTVFNTIVRQMPDFFSGLQTVYVGGEQMNTRWVREVLLNGPPGRLVNVYGPTETFFASFFMVENIPELEYHIPIGIPVSNTSLFIIGDDRRLAPIGVEGELYIGGDGLATCYINNPEQTRNSFVDDFLGADPSGRLYRTGDRVFRQEDGTIVYLGRRDKQVKVRGHRIELGEIEAALEEVDEIEEAAVKIWTNGEDHRLAGYVLVRAGCNADTRSILVSLSSVLPEPMIPSHLEIMDTFPVTPNGKLDRWALPEPSWHPAEPAAVIVPPLTETQKVIAAVWQNVLQHSQIGIHDSFFSVGGDSLMAAQLIARISKAVDQRISIRPFFDHPTIAALASHVEAMHGSAPSVIAPVNRVDSSLRLNAKEEPSRTAGSGARGPHAPLLTADRPGAIVEERALFDLVESGELDSIDAVTVTYIPDWLLNQPDDPGDDLIRSWFDSRNRFSAILSTHLGRIAIATIPRFSHELYTDRDDAMRQIVQVLMDAKLMGAQVASLAGLIPSAFGYGMMIRNALTDDGDFPEVTTGHETTAASVALALDNLLNATKRSMEDECVAFLGLGSIGASSLRLILQIFPHPRRILLCDVYGKRDVLEAEKTQLINQMAFRGDVDIIAARGALPSRFYDATLIVGATNAPDVVEVDRLRPGVLVVDDSSPHCFSSAEVLNRVHERGDIMVTEGGVLQTPRAMTHVRYVPPESARFVKTADFVQMSTRHPERITSCVLSALLCSAFEDSPRSIGAVKMKDSVAQYRRLRHLGYRAAPLHCETVEISTLQIDRFTERFGLRGSQE
ncbi:MAG: hypothetical protein BMS9Abin05_1047 [Rhodothermia bacterium]|nr:MAG: hypothetical protein BMS9Abin05_1047 [Rhodothermia bacterium]